MFLLGLYDTDYRDNYTNNCHYNTNDTDAKITVIDTLNASLGESLMVIYANELKESGASYEDVIAKIEAVIPHINIQFTVNDLFHLQRGGRVSKTVAIVGSALNLKPFLYLNIDGGLSSAGTARGRKKSLRTLIDRMKETFAEHSDYRFPVGIIHGNCQDEAEAIAELIKAETGITEFIISEISPSIGTHAGPGTIGLIYYGQEKAAAK